MLFKILFTAAAIAAVIGVIVLYQRRNANKNRRD
jgi:hypothetical protein